MKDENLPDVAFMLIEKRIEKLKNESGKYGEMSSEFNTIMDEFLTLFRYYKDSLKGKKEI